MDNDNDDLIDECDEDTVPPTIRTDAAARCSEVWFATEDEALECVKSTTIIEDDCHNTTVPAFVVTNSCGNSNVDITVQDGCGNEATTSVQVKINDAEPYVYCQFADEKVFTNVCLFLSLQRVRLTFSSIHLFIHLSGARRSGSDLDRVRRAWSYERPELLLPGRGFLWRAPASHRGLLLERIREPKHLCSQRKPRAVLPEWKSQRQCWRVLSHGDV
mmetsp:Transcript_19376/g.43683  ORF Transcript_19376/g.43683 Transcript_19376/m.43683 type:complete len:217 (+) Transcript_19376:1151-1801(+)